MVSGLQWGYSGWGHSLIPELRDSHGSEMFHPLQGGSFGRGTDLRGYCDIELVIFLNCFKDYGDQRARRREILNEMRAQLESWWQDPVPGRSLSFPEQTVPEALHLQLVSQAPESRVDVSLLPVFDAVGEGCLQPASWRQIPLPAMRRSLSGVEIAHLPIIGWIGENYRKAPSTYLVL